MEDLVADEMRLASATGAGGRLFEVRTVNH
jgi:hypothetical protein